MKPTEKKPPIPLGRHYVYKPMVDSAMNFGREPMGPPKTSYHDRQAVFDKGALGKISKDSDRD